MIWQYQKPLKLQKYVHEQIGARMVRNGRKGDWNSGPPYARNICSRNGAARILRRVVSVWFSSVLATSLRHVRIYGTHAAFHISCCDAAAFWGFFLRAKLWCPRQCVHRGCGKNTIKTMSAEWNSVFGYFKMSRFFLGERASLWQHLRSGDVGMLKSAAARIVYWQSFGKESPQQFVRGCFCLFVFRRRIFK